jgi:hypothetical protein
MSWPHALLAASCTLVLATSAVWADDPPDVRVAVRSELFPAGSIRWQTPFNGMTSGTNVAYGVGASLEYRLSRVFSIALAPRLILNVKGSDLAFGPGKELDLCARVQASWPIARMVRLQAFAAPGYSFVFLTPWQMADALHPRGFVLGLGGGATVDLSHGLFIAGEAGYQLGFQGTTVPVASSGPGPLEQMPVDFHTNYLQVSVAAGSAF